MKHLFHGVWFMVGLPLSWVGCVPQYTVTNDTSARGGEAQTDITDAETCLSRCAETDTCVGADVDFGAGATLCWFHVDVANFDNTFSNPNAYLHRLVDRCPQGKRKKKKKTMKIARGGFGNTY